MGSDFWIVVRWWGTLFLIGAVAFPLTKRLFSGWFDRGYLFAKAVGLVAISYLVWFGASIHLFPFSIWSVIGVMMVVFGVGAGFHYLYYVAGSRYYGKKENTANYILHTTYYNIKNIVVILLEELFFFVALLFWAWVKGHEPSIHGLEKFMDYGFAQSILNSRYFPPPDMWYAGDSINYYYFGHYVMALLTRLSGLDLRYTFNLMLSSLFAFTFTMSFGIGYQLLNFKFQISNFKSSQNVKIYKKSFGFWILKLIGGLLTAFLVTLAGNMQTIYAFTKGYTGEDVKPFWQLMWPLGEFWQKLPDGLNIYWYANATRFIPYTIHEFPSYSFVVSDVHGHVLSLPFVLLAIALLITIFGRFNDNKTVNQEAGIKDQEKMGKSTNDGSSEWILYIFYGILLSVLFMTNVLDAPIYGGLFVVLFMIHNSDFIIHPLRWIQTTGLKLASVIFIAGMGILPFYLHFKSFVSGVAVNCPSASMANSKIGPILFEGVEKCQHSPFWMLWLLWGFFIFCGIVLIVSRILPSFVQGGHWQSSTLNRFKLKFNFSPGEWVLVIFFLYSVALIIFPEFFYFKDIYPMHFRSNTMFKLGYQAFIMWSIVAGYTIISIVRKDQNENFKQNPNIKYQTNTLIKIGKIVFFVLLIPQLFLVSIYPIFSVRSYFDSLREYKTLDGLAWFQMQYPDDYKGIEYLNSEWRIENSELSNSNHNSQFTIPNSHIPTIVEADGDSYTDYERYSAYTGFPTVVGWAVHEWLWRGTYDIVAPRREEVHQIYESTDIAFTRQLLHKYHVSYVIIGTQEREKYKTIVEPKFQELGNLVFSSGETRIYKINR